MCFKWLNRVLKFYAFPHASGIFLFLIKTVLYGLFQSILL